MIKTSTYYSISFSQRESNVFDKLNAFIREWQTVIQIEREFEARQARLYPIGSYALGVLDIDSDIDWVLVTTPQFSRDTDFFQKLVYML